MSQQATTETIPTTISFGAFELNLRASELRRHGLRVKLQEKPFQVLVRLLEQPGEVVSREMLRQRLWQADTFVDFDQSLNSAVKKLRQGLGDSADVPRFIETQARRGYRFVAPVRILQIAPALAPKPEPAVQPPSPRRRRPKPALASGAFAAVILLAFCSILYFRSEANRQPIQTIAVLPLANLSGEAGQDYFADGLTDTLIGDLARIDALRVVSRTSAMQYKGTSKSLPEIARDLHVEDVLEGTVRRSGNRVQISAQLIEAAGDRPLWSQTYERDIKDMLAVQNEIAAAIVQQIRYKLAKPEHA